MRTLSLILPMNPLPPMNCHPSILWTLSHFWTPVPTQQLLHQIKLTSMGYNRKLVAAFTRISVFLLRIPTLPRNCTALHVPGLSHAIMTAHRNAQLIQQPAVHLFIPPNNLHALPVPYANVHEQCIHHMDVDIWYLFQCRHHQVRYTGPSP